VWLAATVLPWLRVPFVAVGHGVEFGARSRFARWLNRRSYKKAAAVVTVSEYTRRRMLESGVAPQRDAVIPNGADAGTFSQLSESALGEFRSRDLIAQPDRRLLITLGRVGRRKGQDLVVRALGRLQENHPDLHYVLIGLPARGDEIETLAAELGVADRVHLLGRQPVDTVRAHLSSADLFVMPSRHTDDGDFEGYGIAVVEAALCGLPAVVAGDSGLAEAVEDGETGVVVPPDDVDALTAALCELLSDGPRRRRMAADARDRALAEKTWRRRGAAYDRLLGDVAGLGPDGDGR
ncbi:MAG: glycosyltransferase family 4 protein, partial [Acidobacteriota bacterium]